MVLERDFPSDIRVENEISAIRELGIEVHLACYTMTNKPSYEESNGLIIHRKPISKLVYKSSIGALRVPLYFNFWVRFIDDLCIKTNYSAIHVHDLALAKPMHKIAKKHNLVSILDLHENWPFHLMEAAHTKKFIAKFFHNDNEWIKYEKSYTPLYDQVITVVEEMEDRMKKIGVKNTSVYQNVPDISQFDLNVDSGKPLNYPLELIYVGGVNENRGIQIPLKAISLLKNNKDKIRFKIIGDGDYLPTLKKIAKELKIEDQVKFFGWIKQNDAYEEIRKSDICLIPHLRSVQTDCSSPNKMYQYFLMKKPVMSSDCNSIKRVVNENKSGVIYKDSSPQDFANALEKLLGHPDQLRTMGENGHNAVLSKYNLNHQKLALQKTYSALGLC